MDWFLYDGDIHHERVKTLIKLMTRFLYCFFNSLYVILKSKKVWLLKYNSKEFVRSRHEVARFFRKTVSEPVFFVSLCPNVLLG